MAATVSQGESSIEGATPSDADLLSKLKYDPIAVVLGQFYRLKVVPDSNSAGQSMNAKKAGGFKASSNNNRRNGNSTNRPRRTEAEMAELKNKFPCRESKTFGHWANDHNFDGTLKQGKRSYDKPSNEQKPYANGSQNNSNSNSNNSDKEPVFGFTSSLHL